LCNHPNVIHIKRVNIYLSTLLYFSLLKVNMETPFSDIDESDVDDNVTLTLFRLGFFELRTAGRGRIPRPHPPPYFM
jgi:hypothetical protein